MARPRVAGQRRGPTPGQALRQQVAAMEHVVMLNPSTADSTEDDVTIRELADVTWPRDGESFDETLGRHEDRMTHDDYLAWAQHQAEQIVADAPADPDAAPWALLIDTWDELTGDETLEIVMYFAQAFAHPQDNSTEEDKREGWMNREGTEMLSPEVVQQIQQAAPALPSEPLQVSLEPARGLRGARLIPADGPVADPAPATVPPDVPRGMKRRRPGLQPAAAAEAPEGAEDAARAAQLAAEDAERRQRKAEALRNLAVPASLQVQSSQLKSDAPTRASGHRLPPSHQWQRDGGGRRVAPEEWSG